MIWRALVPLKAAGKRKRRLAGVLGPAQRAQLTDAMFAHVTQILCASSSIALVSVLSPVRPQGWAGDWVRDQGGGLNAEISAAARLPTGQGLLVIHPDLPLLSTDEITELIALAEQEGAAIAPDRHLSGTNALALAPRRELTFAFGENSFSLHVDQLPGCAVLHRPGLSLDLDTEPDLQLLSDHLPPFEPVVS